MASNFLYLLLKYAPNSRHIAALLKALFKWLNSLLKYLKWHKWATLAIVAVLAVSLVVSPPNLDSIRNPSERSSRSMFILPYARLPSIQTRRPSLKSYFQLDDSTPAQIEDEFESKVLQFTPDMLDGIEEFGITLPEGLQELVCYEDDCYMVVDAMWDLGRGPVATRKLMTHTFDMAVITASEIRMEGPYFNSNHSKNWQVKKDTMFGPYLRVMSTAPFITKTLTMEKQTPNILLIGLGGSSINNFFSLMVNEPNITVVDLQPAMKVIAKKWYGLHENDLHRVLIADGAKFVEERSKSEPKYDVILLDACHDSPPNSFVCPVEIFHNDDIVRHMRRNLADNGTLVVNVVMMGEFNNLLIELRQKFEKHFGSCYFAHINHQLVLTCTAKKTPRMNDAEYYKRYKENVPEDLQEMLIERIHVRQDLYEDTIPEEGFVKHEG